MFRILKRWAQVRKEAAGRARFHTLYRKIYGGGWLAARLAYDRSFRAYCKQNGGFAL